MIVYILLMIAFCKKFYFIEVEQMITNEECLEAEGVNCVTRTVETVSSL